MAQTPAISVENLIKNSLLIPALPQFEAEAMPVSLLYPSRRQPPKRLVIFTAWRQSIVIKTHRE